MSTPAHSVGSTPAKSSSEGKRRPYTPSSRSLCPSNTPSSISDPSTLSDSALDRYLARTMPGRRSQSQKNDGKYSLLKTFLGKPQQKKENSGRKADSLRTQVYGVRSSTPSEQPRLQVLKPHSDNPPRASSAMAVLPSGANASSSSLGPERTPSPASHQSIGVSDSCNSFDEFAESPEDFSEQLGQVLFSQGGAQQRTTAPAEPATISSLTADSARRMSAVQELLQRCKATLPHGDGIGRETITPIESKGNISAATTLSGVSAGPTASAGPTGTPTLTRLSSSHSYDPTTSRGHARLHAMMDITQKFHHYVTTSLAAMHLDLGMGDDARQRELVELRKTVKDLKSELRETLSEKATMARQLARLAATVNEPENEVSNSTSAVGSSFSPQTNLFGNGMDSMMGSVAFNMDAVVIEPENVAIGKGGTPDTGHGELEGLFDIHANVALDHSVSVNPNQGNSSLNATDRAAKASISNLSNTSFRSTRSASSQIKSDPLSAMARSRRSEMLQKKKMAYRLGNVIGSGAHGVVYLSLIADTGETVAAKQVLFSTEDPHWENRLKNLQTEISVLRKIEHDNCVQYLFTDRVDRNGTPGMLIFMEYVAGGSMANIMGNFGALPEKTAAIFGAQVLLGLRHLHENGIVHRDIKPANCLLSPFGIVKVADFGTALIVNVEDELERNGAGVNTETMGSDLVGTPLYMAPEVVRSEDVTSAADVWSFGCTMMEILTGQAPWAHLNPLNAWSLLQIVAGDNEELELPSNLSDLAKDLLRQCLRKDPKERPTTTQLLRHPWFQGYDVLMLSFDRNASTGSLQIRPDVIENIGVQIAESVSARPPLGASISAAPNFSASISHMHRQRRRSSAEEPTPDAEVQAS